MWGLGGVSSDADGAADEASVENDCKEGQRVIDDLDGYIHSALQSLLAGGSAEKKTNHLTGANELAVSSPGTAV